MYNAVISLKKPIDDPRFNPLGKSLLDGGYLYEVEYSVIDLRNNPPVEKVKLLSPQEMQQSIDTHEYVNAINIYDPYNYKEHFKNKEE
jgi:hypothetical protein